MSEKPPIREVHLVCKIILTAVLLSVAVSVLCSSVIRAQRYRIVAADPLVLDAEIVRVDVNYDEDGDTYDAVMMYVYNNVSYTNDYDTYHNESDAEAMVGKTVTIRVDPESPGDVLEEIHRKGKNNLLIAAILVGLSLFAQRIRHRESWSVAFGWNRENAQRDMNLVIWEMYPWYVVLTPLAVYYAVALHFADVYYEFSFGDGIAMFLAAVGVWLLCCFLRDMRLLRNERFTLRRDVCVGKKIVPDSDGPDSYYLTYSNGEETWSKKVPLRIYDSIQKGDTTESAYLEGDKRPILNYTLRNGTF